MRHVRGHSGLPKCSKNESETLFLSAVNCERPLQFCLRSAPLLHHRCRRTLIPFVFGPRWFRSAPALIAGDAARRAIISMLATAEARRLVRGPQTRRYGACSACTRWGLAQPKAARTSSDDNPYSESHFPVSRNASARFRMPAPSLRRFFAWYNDETSPFRTRPSRPAL